MYAVIAYCPITDLPHADAVYEYVHAALKDVELNAGTDDKARVSYTANAGTVNEEVYRTGNSTATQ